MEITNIENSRRIAKNTLLLYFRMFLLMFVSLYTSRVVLNILGVEDFGIYNVVGGVVTMFTFLSSSMTSATQRFISFELGRKDYSRLKKVFSMSINIHAIFALVIFILAETIGLWFLNNKLVIPEQRMSAANWIYQFTILSLMITIMNVPYNSIIIANEKMNFYAYVSVFEVLFKLIIVFTLTWFGFDKLKVYGFLIFCVAFIVWMINKVFCNRNYEESKYCYYFEKILFRNMMSFGGWSIFGNIANVAMGQGINIILNMFFGPVVNAARGIAYQVNSAVSSFVGNFQIAINPQIVKSYAIGDMEYMKKLIFRGAKYSFFLLFVVTMPLLLETDIIIKIWLINIPDHTVLFCRLVIINTLIDFASGPLITAVQATGKIKKYQLFVSSLLLLNLPASYLLLKMGLPPQTTMFVSIIISIIALFLRFFVLKQLILISFKEFLKEVLIVIFYVSVVSTLIPLFFRIYIDPGFLRLIIVLVSSLICTSLSVFFIGLNINEKMFIKNRIKISYSRLSNVLKK